jgi:hypothetical protein
MAQDPIQFDREGTTYTATYHETWPGQSIRHWWYCGELDLLVHPADGRRETAAAMLSEQPEQPGGEA